MTDPSAKLVLIKLADSANDDGVCWPSQQTLGADCGLSERSVRYKIDKLVASNLLAVEKRRSADGKRERNLYRLAITSGNGLPVVVVASGNGLPVSQRQPVAGEPSVNLEPPEKTSSSQSSLKIQDVYDCWRSERKKTNARYATMSPGRKQKIQTRLQEFTVDELKLAIKNVALDPWAERGRHDDLTVIFRSREQVEKFLEMHSNGDSNGSVYSRGEPGEQA